MWVVRTGGANHMPMRAADYIGRVGRVGARMGMAPALCSTSAKTRLLGLQGVVKMGGMNISTLLSVGILASVISLCSTRAAAEVLDKQKQLDAQTFWDNRDSDWYRANIPF